MTGKFVPAAEATRETLDWGILGLISTPPETGAKDLTVMEADIKPGECHSFHKHPDQEEVIYIVEGELEQWLEKEGRIMKKGDSVFIGAGVVHASFNVSDKSTKFLAILGPCVGESGYAVVEVADQEPWKSLR